MKSVNSLNNGYMAITSLLIIISGKCHYCWKAEVMTGHCGRYLMSSHFDSGNMDMYDIPLMYCCRYPPLTGGATDRYREAPAVRTHVILIRIKFHIHGSNQIAWYCEITDLSGLIIAFRQYLSV